MQDASQQLQQNQPQQAQPHQQRAESSLRSLYQQMMQAQQQMSMQAQADAAAALQKAARQVLDVSFRQETVAKQPGAAGSNDGDAAEQQQSLLSATGKVVGELDALAQQSMAAPPQVTQLLGEAMARMRDGVRNYERGNTAAGRGQAEDAYGYLNRAVVELNRALSQAASCPKPGGGPGSPQQRMEQMMGEQQQLNAETQRLQKSIPNPQNLSPEERAQMARLLGQQQSIQTQLQEIERQAREQKELLGRLDRMQDEMREVVEDLDSQTLDEETLRVQERIVSRMLDAQRSLHKRDFNEERESRTAEEVFSKGGRTPQQDERVKKLRRDIERAMRESTPEEYQDLVREYFKAIAETPAETPAVRQP
jgi:tetratricopeptide (TPR) repeat protein